MAITETPPFFYPNLPVKHIYGYYVNSTSDLVLDATAEKVALCFVVPKSGTISKISFYVRAVTTADTLKAGLYNFDASGNPDVTSAYGGMVAGTVSVTGAGRYEVTLATPATVVRGDHVCAIVSFNSFVAGNIAIGNLYFLSSTLSHSFPLLRHYTGSWSSKNFPSSIAIKYDDNSFAYIDNTLPISGTGYQLSITQTGSPDEVGIKFTLPVQMRVMGVLLPGMSNTSFAEHDTVLYDANNQVVASISKPIIVHGKASGTKAMLFASSVTLDPNVAYRAIVKPTSNNNVVMSVASVLSGSLAQLGFGSNYAYTSRTDAGVWSDDTTTFLPLILIVDGIGGGGGSMPGIGGLIR